MQVKGDSLFGLSYSIIRKNTAVFIEAILVVPKDVFISHYVEYSTKTSTNELVENIEKRAINAFQKHFWFSRKM